MKSFKAVFFDIDGTLLDHDAASESGLRVFLECAKDFDIQAIDPSWQTWKRIENRFMDQYVAGELGFEEQRRQRLRHFFAPTLDASTNSKLDELFSYYLSGYEKGWRLFGDVMPALNALAPYTLGVITNGDAKQQAKKLKHLEINDRFKFVFSSSSLGVSKPDPRAFLRACELAHLEPGEVIYVGDRLDVDARAAARAGLWGIWLSRAGAGAPVSDVVTIDDLRGLPFHLA